LHILFVWSYWQYPKVALEFLEKVRKRGHRVSVLLGDSEGKVDAKRFRGEIDFFFASKLDVLSRITGTPYPVFRDVSSCIRMVDPDVVHVNSHLFLGNYQAVRASRSLGIPCVVTVHGFSAKRSFVLDALQDVYLRTVARLIFESASKVICLTESDAASVAGIAGGYNKIVIIPNGVDTELFKPSLNRESDLIAWVGRLVPEKGLGYLLRAMQEIVEECPNARLVLVGDGILKSELVRLTDELGLNDHVKFLGVLDRVGVAEVLSKASVLAFPSLKEGLPFSVLEAMACGVPVVGSDISGVRDVVKRGETGLLVPPKDSRWLAESVVSLLKDEGLRRAMGEEARRTTIQSYSWSRVMQKLDDVYHDAIKKSSDQRISSSSEVWLPDEDLCRDSSDSN